MQELAKSVDLPHGTEDAGMQARILLVDDREGNLIALEAILKDLGQKLVRAQSGEEALRSLLDGDFAVILLDVRMPDMDGFETAELMRKRQRSRHTPIIFITAADASPDQVARGYAVGAVDYIFKPFMPEVLKAKVRIFLDLFKKTEELRESESRLRTLVANVPGAMYRRKASSPWGMLFISDPVEKLVGYPASDFIEGRRSYDGMIHLDDAPALSEALREAVRKRAQYALEYRLQHPDGRIRWVHDRGQGVAEDSRAISHIDGVLLEITDRKVAEGTLGELTGRLLQTQDDERRRIARELHDSTSPLLTSLITKLYTLRHRTRDLDATTSKTLDDSLKLADETSSVIRSVSYLLHPRLLDENGLLASLRWYLSGFADRTGIRVEVKFPEEVSGLSREAETTLFRIVQESLTNILRHSGSTVAKVRIAAEKQELTLTVGDEGQGIPPGTLERIRQGAIALGVGIPGMRERMSQLGGRLEINSTGAGTTVRATLPLGETKN